MVIGTAVTFAVGYVASLGDSGKAFNVHEVSPGILSSRDTRPDSDVYWQTPTLPELQQFMTTRPELARDLGVSHAAAVVVGTIIGSGIFLVPAEMMQAVGSAKLVYLAWLVGGLLSFFGALTYAELGAMKPQAGGEYVYVRDAYGPLAGFLYALDVVRHRQARLHCDHRYRPGAHSRDFLGLFVFSQIAISFPFAISWGQLVAIAAAILISLLNYLGVKKAGEFQLVFTVLKVAIILGIVAICFSGAGSALVAVGVTLPATSPGPRAGSPDSWPRWSRRCGPMTDGMT